MKFFISIALLFVFLTKMSGQNPGCSDSIVFNKFSPTFFNSSYDGGTGSGYRPQIDLNNNSYIGGTLGGASNYTNIIKFNNNNNLVWSKWYRPLNSNSLLKNFGTLKASDDSANLFLAEGLAFNTQGNILTKLDSSGNFKWARSYYCNEIQSGQLFHTLSPSGSNLYLQGFSGISGDTCLVTALNNTGNIIWSKKYYRNNLPNYFVTGTILNQIKPGFLVIVTTGYFNNVQNPLDPNAVHNIQITKINSTDGSIVLQKSFMFYSDAGALNPIRVVPAKINYNNSTNTFVLSCVSNTFNIYDYSKQVYSLLDTNFNITKTAYYTAPGFSTASNSSQDYADINISKNNYSSFVYSFTNNTYSQKSISYITLNDALDLTAQRKIDYTNFGFPNLFIKTNIGFKQNGILNFQSAAYTNGTGNTQNTVLIYDHIPFYNSLSPCLGYDTVFFYKTPVYTQTVPLASIVAGNNTGITVTDIIPDNLPLEENTLPETEICKQVSICDTIKITGQSFHCPGIAIDSFKLVRNPLCKRVTQWSTDTTAVKIISKNDTTLYVQFIKPYNGFIKVNFAGCTLSDSIAITVYNVPAAGLNLGSDITACPGTPVTLHAGTGFKTYQWQDGSSNESFTATQPGKYYVTATDSCGRLYADTLLINAPQVIPPQLGNDTMHCPGKTITFHAGSSYQTYRWQDGSSTESFTAAQPGKYYVTVTDNCNRILSDTIIVLPQDVPLTINYPQELCTWDTAKINLPLLITNYSWQPFNIARLGFNNQLLLYPGITTTYSISGERPKGCILQDTVLIKTKICPDFVFFPNAFTPNGDGLNDIYKPFIGGRLAAYEFIIFNRYGQPVFKTTDPGKGWDGSFNNSTKPLPGSFVWLCKYQFYNQPMVQKKGMLTLIR